MTWTTRSGRRAENLLLLNRWRARVLAEREKRRCCLVGPKRDGLDAEDQLMCIRDQHSRHDVRARTLFAKPLFYDRPRRRPLASGCPRGTVVRV